MAKIVNGNLLDAPDKLIAHQVNCKGVMGAGLAKTIRERHPSVFASYIKVCAYYSPHELLGRIQRCNIGGKRIINMFAQDGFGRDGVHTNYEAFRSCLEKIRLMLDADDALTVAFPYGIGCGLAGGDWSVISEMIDSTLPPEKVTLYKL